MLLTWKEAHLWTSPPAKVALALVAGACGVYLQGYHTKEEVGKRKTKAIENERERARAPARDKRSAAVWLAVFLGTSMRQL